MILGALPAGLAMGASTWLVIGGAGLAAANIAPYEQKFEKPIATLSSRPLPADALNEALASPLFALTTGHGAVAEVALRLDGVARTPRRNAALLSIGGKPAEWLELGQTRDDVTLQDVQSSQVVVDTATGFKTIALGDTSQAAPAPGTDKPQGPAGSPPGRPPSPSGAPGGPG